MSLLFNLRQISGQAIAALLLFCLAAAVQASAAVSPVEARAIAKEAYIYGFPVVDNYRIQYIQSVDSSHPNYKAPFNVLANVPRLFTAEDRAIQTPNSDTPYSFIGLDLRAEPLVFTIPPIENDRYWSLQFVDLFTHNVAFLGSRTTGNGGGSYMLAGPGWRGKIPRGIKQVVRGETSLMYGQFRTQLKSANDLEAVKAIQNRYLVQPLSAYLKQPAAKAAPTISFIKPLSREDQKTSLEFFEILNFALQFAPKHPSEVKLRKRFAQIGIIPGRPFDLSRLSPEMKQALRDGMADGWKDFDSMVARLNKREITSAVLFGTRDYLRNDYLKRMTGAVLGIYGNSKEETIYPSYYVDAMGQKLDGANRYTVRFAPGELPPVNSFWSLTMYQQPESLLVANPINRYLLNSPMLPQFKRDADGGITLLIQNESPGVDFESNWLPAPKAQFSVIMRLYWPKQEALDGRWAVPPLNRVNS